MIEVYDISWRNTENSAVALGYFDSIHIPELAELTDTFLWDYKLSDPELHKKYTGHSNKRIIENLRQLDMYPVDIRLRCIMVAGVNMTSAHASAIAEIFSSLEHCREVELLPYHAYGASKAAQSGIHVEPHREWIPDEDSLSAFACMLTNKGVRLHAR